MEKSISAQTWFNYDIVSVTCLIRISMASLYSSLSLANWAQSQYTIIIIIVNQFFMNAGHNNMTEYFIIWVSAVNLIDKQMHASRNKGIPATAFLSGFFVSN